MSAYEQEEKEFMQPFLCSLVLVFFLAAAMIALSFSVYLYIFITLYSIPYFLPILKCFIGF